MTDRSKRFVGFSPAVWQEVADLLRAGKMPTEISRMPGMPSAVRIGQRRREDPEFFAGSVAAPLVRHSAETWDLVAELLHDGIPGKVISRMPGMPHWTTIGQRCRTDPDLNQFVDRHRKIARDRLAKVIERLREGASLQQIMRREKVIGYGTLAKYRKQSRALDKMITTLAAANHAAQKQALRDQSRRRRHAVDPAFAMEAVEKAVPRTLPMDVRREVVAMMLADIVEGSLALYDVAGSVSAYRTRFYRQFSKFGPQSLDAPAYRDGGRTTIAETVSEGMW